MCVRLTYMEIESEDYSENLLGSDTEDEEPEKPTEERLYPIELDETNINKRSQAVMWAYTDFNLTRIRFTDAEVKYKIEGNETCPSTGSKRETPMAPIGFISMR